MKAPEKIYLQVDGDSIGDSYEDWDGTCTWCQDRINDTDVEYVEASKIEALENQLAEAEEIIKEYANSKWERIARPAQDYIDKHNL